MAAFSDVGANCFLESCKEKDFLPFTCDNCGFVFCLEHRTALSHGCPVKPDEHRVIICDKCEKSIRLYTNETETAALTRHSKAGCFKQPPGPRCPVLVGHIQFLQYLFYVGLYNENHTERLRGLFKMSSKDMLGSSI